MAVSLKNWKTYILIDFENEVYGFVNGPSDLDKFYSDLSISLSSLNKDSENILVDAFLVNIKTKEEIPIKYSAGDTLCI